MKNDIIKEADFIWGDKIKMEHVDWLWHNRFAKGMLTLLVGLGGVGKSTFTNYMAAQITTGRPWIDDAREREPGDVIILSTEDDPGVIIMPRLTAMKADIRRVCVLRGTKQTIPPGCLNEGRSGYVGLEDLTKSGDLKYLHDTLEQAPHPKLVIIDPYTSYMGNIDSNDNIKTRNFLLPIAETAKHFGVAIIAITHLNKKEDCSAVARILGSVGQQNVARQVWLMVEDKQNELRRYIVWLKGNYAPRWPGLAYNILNEDVLMPDGYKSNQPVCCFEKEPVHLTADELLAPRDEKRGRPKKQIDAAEWLEEFLSEGPVNSKLIEDEGKILGYSKSTLERIKSKMGIMAIPIREKNSITIIRWEWRLRSS